MAFSLPHAIDVTQNGFLQTLLSEGIFTYCTRIAEISSELNVLKIFTLTLLIAIIAGTTFLLNKDDKAFEHSHLFMIAGFVFMLLSYLVFGLSPEYNPQLDSIMNRINIGASIGASIFISAFLYWLTNKLKKDQFAHCATLIALVSPIVIFFILADWGWAKPWITSWTFQKHVIKLVKQHAANLSDNDAVILAHVPRYVMWSPLFDGVWDFQSMLRMYSHAPNIKGGVASDRMQLSQDQIKDISAGYLCGTYPFHIF